MEILGVQVTTATPQAPADGGHRQGLAAGQGCFAFCGGLGSLHWSGRRPEKAWLPHTGMGSKGERKTFICE